MSGLGLIREGLPVLPRKLENSQAITQGKENLLKSRGRESDTQDCGRTCLRSHCKSLVEMDPQSLGCTILSSLKPTQNKANQDKKRIRLRKCPSNVRDASTSR